MEFVDQLKSSVDIVQVVGEYVRLRKSGINRYSGLCPFHTEKTPSFSIHAAHQFYICFGCGAKGDVIKFVMEIEGLSFYEALKLLAERNGIPMPRRAEYSDPETKLRAALYQMHELAEEAFRKLLASTPGAAARAYLDRRSVAPETAAHFGLGLSDRSGRHLLRLFEQHRFSNEQMEASGLIGKRQDGSLYDRFRNRLMFPIHNESGKIIGFGGRALEAGDEPKYLNSPETPIYKKSHVLYNLHRAKEGIRKGDRAVLVEGYMDVIGVTASGVREVVASCGTALTALQVRALKRHSANIVVNFDPDAAGANAAERSINLLLDESMHVRIAELEGGLDPDEFCQQHGVDTYRARLEGAKRYFDWLADRARSRFDTRSGEGRVAALQFLLPAIQRIGDRLERLTIANDVAGYLGVGHGVVLDYFKKAVAERRDQPMAVAAEPVTANEAILLNLLFGNADARARFLPELQQSPAVERFASRRVFQAIFAVTAAGGPFSFEAVHARLEEPDQHLLAAVLFAHETDEPALSLEQGEACLGALRGAGHRARVAELKSRIREAERSGNLNAAIAFMEELNRLERDRTH